MYNGLEKIKDVLAYIEENMTSELKCDALAKKMNLSVYEFRRIFSFIIGCPISEYIRKRRLSVAACEMLTSEKTDLLLLSEKYGYASQAAFKEHHGCTPTECMKGEHAVKLFTMPETELRVSGPETIPFKIKIEEDFCVCGHIGRSTVTDSCCCENVWNEFYENKIDKKIGGDKIYAAYDNEAENVVCALGQKTSEPIPDLPYVRIKRCRWACFKANTVEDEIVNKIYGNIIYNRLPSANLVVNKKMPTLEVYPFDTEKDGFEWEIRIPVE